MSNLTGSVAGYLYERGNLFNNKPADATSPYPFTNVEYKAYNGEKIATPYTYDDFKPAYNYIVDPVGRIAEIVPSASGVGKLTGYSAAPKEVDNGGITGGGTTPDPDPGTDPTPGGSDLGNGWTLLSNGTTAATGRLQRGPVGAHGMRQIRKRHADPRVRLPGGHGQLRGYRAGRLLLRPERHQPGVGRAAGHS